MASPALIFLILMISSLTRAVYGVILDVRLEGGGSPNEGTIKYTDDCQTWHTLCGNKLTRTETDIICRYLGFGVTHWVLNTTSPSFDGMQPTASSHITCNGDEPSVLNCSLEMNCDGGNYPGGVVCYNETNYIGCFTDNTRKRVLNHLFRNDNFTGLTIDGCLNFCRQHNSMVFAGVENSIECYCSNDSMTNLTIHGQRATDQECNYVCDGSEYERCGGPNRIAIFNLTAHPRLSPYPMDSPCDTTTPPVSTMSSEVTEIIQATSQETLASTQGLRTSDTSENGSTSQTPSTAPYGAIGGGVAVVVGSIVIIIIIIVLRRKSNEKEDQKYGVCEMTNNTSGSPGYDNSIVGFHEATDGDTTDDLYGVVEKDAFSAQMKRSTMIVEYVNVKGKAGNTPAVAEPDHSYANMAANTTGNDALTSKDVGGSDELYAMSTKHRQEPDGREVAKEEADMYAVPDKGRKSQPSHDALGKSHSVEEADDAGDLYAMLDKNRRSKNAITSSRSDDIEMMYAIPDKPRFGQLHDNDDDTTEMVENELYG